MSKDHRPKCTVPGCRRRAYRWDGGIIKYTVKEGDVQPCPIHWVCKQHDPYHKSFDLPETFSAALQDLVSLREDLQLHVRERLLEENDLRTELDRWRSLYLDKPEDRLWHDSDQTWWRRKDDSHLGVGGLFRGEPPEPVQKLEKENAKLRSQVARLKARLKEVT